MSIVRRGRPRLAQLEEVRHLRDHHRHLLLSPGLIRLFTCQLLQNGSRVPGSGVARPYLVHSLDVERCCVRCGVERAYTDPHIRIIDALLLPCALAMGPPGRVAMASGFTKDDLRTIICIIELHGTRRLLQDEVSRSRDAYHEWLRPYTLANAGFCSSFGHPG